MTGMMRSILGAISLSLAGMPGSAYADTPVGSKLANSASLALDATVSRDVGHGKPLRLFSGSSTAWTANDFFVLFEVGFMSSITYQIANGNSS